MELKAKYYEALMEYGLYWIESDDPLIKSLLQWPMYSINRTNEDIEKKSKAKIWNQNAKKDRTKLANHNKTMENNEEQWETIEDNAKHIEERKKKEWSKNKILYLEKVWLLESEYDKLVSEYWRSKTDEYINKLNYYIQNHWDKYSSHYLTILNWMRKAKEKKKSELIDDSNKPYDFSQDKIILPVRPRKWMLEQQIPK